MGKLEDLEEELYGKEADTIGSRRKRKFMLFPMGKSVRTSWGERSARSGMIERFSFSRATAIFILAAFLFVVGGVAFVFVYLGSERREAEVTIGGRDIVESGELFTFVVNYRNISSSVLEEVELAVALPSDSSIQDSPGIERPAPPRLIRAIGALQPGKEGKSEFAVRLLGRKGEEKEINAGLVYRPAGLRARFSSYALKRVTVDRVPLIIYWDIPETVSSRQEVAVTLRYSSHARSPFENLWLRLDYPPGFALTSVFPKASSGDALWDIGTLQPGEERTIEFKGRFSGGGGEVQALHAGLGAFNELTKEWKPWQESTREVKLSSAPFLLESAFEGKREGVIKPGDPLRFEVSYHNRSALAVKDISIRVALEGEIVDFSTLSISEGGVFDFSTRTIVWGPGGTEGLREVRSDTGGRLHFQVNALKQPAVRTSADTRLTVRVRTRIEVPRLPQEFEGVELSPEDLIEFKVGTVALVANRAVFRTSPISNTGPLPPRVGEKTTYVIVWETRNLINEIENAEIRAFLPPNVHWEGVVSPQGADIRFDAASSEVRWRIGKIPAGTGVLTPARVTAFQVAIVPSEIDAGKSVMLAINHRFSGRDSFTVEEIALRLGDLDIGLKDDPATNAAEWMVIR